MMAFSKAASFSSSVRRPAGEPSMSQDPEEMLRRIETANKQAEALIRGLDERIDQLLKMLEGPQREAGELPVGWVV